MGKGKTVLRVLQLHTSAQSGGSEHQLLTLSENLDRTRYRVIVACPDNGPLFRKIQEAGIGYRRMPSTNALSLSHLVGLIRILRKEDIDILHAHDYPSNTLACLASYFSSTPVRLYTKHSARTPLDYLSNRYSSMLERYIGRRIRKTTMHAVIAVSQAVRNTLIVNEGFPEEMIFTVRNGVSFNRFSQVPERQQARYVLGIPKSVPVLVCVARLSLEKGHTYLLQALAKLKSEFPTLHTLIVGDGPLREGLELQSHQLDLGGLVLFLGYQDDTRIALAAADVAVLPSVHEGFGLVVVESMCAGKPVVCSRTGGLTELVEDGVNGFLAEPANPSSLAIAIARLISNPILMTTIGRRNAIRANQEFNVERMAKETQELYELLWSQYVA